MTMYRVYAIFVPIGKTKSTLCGIAGVNALEQNPLWDVRVVEPIEVNEKD